MYNFIEETMSEIEAVYYYFLLVNIDTQIKHSNTS